MISKQNILGLLGLAMRAGKICFGNDACIENVEKKKVKLIIVAEDAAERTKKNFKILCEQYQIPIQIWNTIEENSKAIGKKNKAIIGIKDISFAKQINKMINGGEFIG